MSTDHILLVLKTVDYISMLFFCTFDYNGLGLVGLVSVSQYLVGLSLCLATVFLILVSLTQLFDTVEICVCRSLRRWCRRSQSE